MMIIEGSVYDARHPLVVAEAGEAGRAAVLAGIECSCRNGGRSHYKQVLVAAETLGCDAIIVPMSRQLPSLREGTRRRTSATQSAPNRPHQASSAELRKAGFRRGPGRDRGSRLLTTEPRKASCLPASWRTLR